MASTSPRRQQAADLFAAAVNDLRDLLDRLGDDQRDAILDSIAESKGPQPARA